MKKTIYKYDLKHMYATTPNTKNDNTLNPYYYLNYNEKLICDIMDSEYNRTQAQQEIEAKKQSIASNKIYDFSKKVTIDGENNRPTYDKVLFDKMYKTLFNECKYTKKAYTSINDFICNEYINITKGLVKVLATKCSNKFAMDIVNKGYEDPIFNDLTQEVSIVLLENKDDIKNNNNYYDISDVIIKCFRVLNKYAYQQKKYYDNCVYDIIGFDENTQEDIILKTNTQIYNNYCLACADELTDIQVAQFNKIIEIVKDEIRRTQKDKAGTKILQVFDLILQGYSRKDIMLFMDSSGATITKYHKIIKDCFYNVFRKPYYINKYKKQEKYIINNKCWFTEKRQDTNINYDILRVFGGFMDSETEQTKQAFNNDFWNNPQNRLYGIKKFYNTSKIIKQDNVKSMRMDTYIY